jgi:hypothetical protein
LLRGAGIASRSRRRKSSDHSDPRTPTQLTHVHTSGRRPFQGRDTPHDDAAKRVMRLPPLEPNRRRRRDPYSHRNEALTQQLLSERASQVLAVVSSTTTESTQFPPIAQSPDLELVTNTVAVTQTGIPSLAPQPHAAGAWLIPKEHKTRDMGHERCKHETRHGWTGMIA